MEYGSVDFQSYLLDFKQNWIRQTMASIVACVVLFNITRVQDGEEPPDDYEVRSSDVLHEELPQTPISVNRLDQFTARNRLLNDYFPS